MLVHKCRSWGLIPWESCRRSREKWLFPGRILQSGCVLGICRAVGVSWEFVCRWACPEMTQDRLCVLYSISRIIIIILMMTMIIIYFTCHSPVNQKVWHNLFIWTIMSICCLSLTWRSCIMFWTPGSRSRWPVGFVVEYISKSRMNHPSVVKALAYYRAARGHTSTRQKSR